MQSTSLFMCSQVCLCVIERTIGVWTSVKVLHHERDVQGKLPSLSNQALRDDALSLCLSTETVRSMPLVVQRSLFFTLEELRYEEPTTEAGRALAWPFFFGLRTVFVSRSDWRRKESKQGQSSSLRWIEESRIKVIVSSSGVHAYMSKIDQTQGRAGRAIDRAPAPERPRLWNDLRNQSPGSPCGDQQKMQTTVHHVAQARIYRVVSTRLSLQAASLSARKTGSSCSTKLCTTAVEICTTVLPSSPLCFSQVMAYLWVSVNKSTSSAVAQWRQQTKCDLYMNQLLKGCGAGDSSWWCLFFSFFWWPSSTIEGKAEVAGFSVRMRPLNSATTSTHSHVRPWWRRAVLQGGDDTRRR